MAWYDAESPQKGCSNSAKIFEGSVRCASASVTGVGISVHALLLYAGGLSISGGIGAATSTLAGTDAAGCFAKTDAADTSVAALKNEAVGYYQKVENTVNEVGAIKNTIASLETEMTRMNLQA